MAKKKSKGIDTKKAVVIVVIVLVILFGLAMIYQGTREEGGDGSLGTYGPGGSGMIHEWKFDGDLNDSIGRADKKELGTTTVVEYVPGVVGLAVKLDYNDSLRALNRYLQDIPNNKFTLDFCMKAEKIRGNGIFIEKKRGNTGFAVRADTTRVSGWAIGRPDDWVDCFMNIVDNQWHHVALTAKKGDNKTIWIDGVKCSENDALGPGLRNNRNFYQGRRLYEGLLDEEALWNRVLSNSEIRARAAICMNVAGVPSPGSGGVICNDSDGGKNYTIKGTTNTTREESTDTCNIGFDVNRPKTANYSCAGDNCYLVEYYCGDGVDFEKKRCDCRDGACIS